MMVMITSMRTSSAHILFGAWQLILMDHLFLCVYSALRLLLLREHVLSPMVALSGPIPTPVAGYSGWILVCQRQHLLPGSVLIVLEKTRSSLDQTIQWWLKAIQLLLTQRYYHLWEATISIPRTFRWFPTLVLIYAASAWMISPALLSILTIAGPSQSTYGSKQAFPTPRIGWVEVHFIACYLLCDENFSIC